MIKYHRSQRGFTIVELMIATTVLSVLLLLATTIITNIGGIYTKGINQSRTQDNTRSIVNQVTQDLQYGSADDPVSVSGSVGSLFLRDKVNEYAYCVGTVRYTFVTGYRLNDKAVAFNYPFQHILWRDTVSSAVTGCTLPQLPVLDSHVPLTGGTELIAPNSFLTSFSIASESGTLPITSPYNVKISSAFGDPKDLTLWNNGPPTPSFNTTCKGGAGDQFCATAGLETVVVKRLD